MDNQIEVTEEMVRRGCKAIHDMGGIHFNPHISRPDAYTAEVREILEAALGLRDPACDEPEPDYDPGPSLTDQYRAAWESKFGPGGTHRRG